jgi:hydroxyacylglutathione hydrolase
MTPLLTAAPLWLAATNCYVLAAERGGPAVVVDVPPDAAGVSGVLASIDCYPVALLVTHGHIDHVGAAGKLAADAAVTAYLHPDDLWLAMDPASQLRTLFGSGVAPGDYEPPESFGELRHGQRLDVAGFAVDVLHTPGHTPGHCCFHLADLGILFSGDQLFAGSIGRTDLPGGDQDALMRSMRDQVLTLPDETAVLPGHGATTTLAAERRSNPFLQGL